MWRAAIAIGVLALVSVMACGAPAFDQRAEAIDLALAHVQMEAGEVEADLRVIGPDDVEVLLVRDVGSQDDSVRAIRHIVTISADGQLRVLDERQEWACHPGRGHQGFSTAPCV